MGHAQTLLAFFCLSMKSFFSPQLEKVQQVQYLHHVIVR